MDLKDFFSAAEARTDRWCEMNTVGRAWESAIAQGQPADKLQAQAAQLLGEISPLESYWAYPGSRLMAFLAIGLTFLLSLLTIRFDWRSPAVVWEEGLLKITSARDK